jgi:hypothetical protein
VLAIVEDYAARRIQWNGCARQELALEVYLRKVVERLTDAIEPDDTAGEPPLLPVINPALREKYGLEMSSFIIENISLPPEVEKVEGRGRREKGRASE